jgi:translation initiation factor 2 alpha subunit (eIF-2alpha)
MTNLEVGDIVMCTVDRIVGTVVFVKIDGNGEGGIILSEIAPGRIRNLRDYVVPKKEIVCKVLRISGDRIDLSLRRVTQKEQKEIKEQYKQERSYINILKTVLKEDADKIIKRILEEEKIYEFLQEARDNPKKLEEITGKTNSKKILEILNSQKQKKIVLKREISLTTAKPDGLELIKKNLKEIKGAEIKYISAGKYLIKKEGSDLKTLDNELKEIITRIEKKAKEQGMEFSVKTKERKP